MVYGLGQCRNIYALKYIFYIFTDFGSLRFLINTIEPHDGCLFVQYNVFVSQFPVFILQSVESFAVFFIILLS